MARSSRANPFDEADIELAARETAIDFSVFVGGPEIKREWSAEEWEKRPVSARLRRDLCAFVSSLGYNPILGEHERIAELAEQHMPARISVAVSETSVAKNCDCVVLIPDSPGSFCELGAWATMRAIAPKMLILANAQYKDFKSFLNPGVFNVAQAFGSVLRWVDYGDLQAVTPIVSDFLGTHYARRMVERVYHE
jgi:hypothetical protein